MNVKFKITVILFFSSMFVLSQNENEVKYSLSYFKSIAINSPSSSIQYPEPTYALNGINMNIFWKSKIKHLYYMTGSMYLMGANLPNESTTYGGGCYVGPYFSSNGKLIDAWAYVGLGIFSFHDDVMKLNSTGQIDYYKESNFTAPGTKSSLGFSLNLKKFSFNMGYLIFATASQNTTLFQHGLELGVGVKFD